MIIPHKHDSFIANRDHGLLLHNICSGQLNLCCYAEGDYYLFLKTIDQDRNGKPVHEWTTDPNEALGFEKISEIHAAAKLLPKDWMLCVHCQVSEILGLVRESDGKFIHARGYAGLKRENIERFKLISDL